MTSIYEPMSSSPSTLASSSSLHYYYPAFQYLPPNKGGGVLHFPNPYPYYQPKASQPPFLYPMYPVLLPRPQPNPVLLPQPQPNPVSGDQGGIESKAARIERRMARQRRLFLSRSTANSGSSSCSTQMDISSAGSDMQNKDLYFRMPDMKELRVLFKKELKKSDVGSWGRIVIPKKEAEKYLPSLDEKQGIELSIRDVHSNHVWGLKYKYWANNKSRMYVFESAGNFIRKNELEVGDCIFLYEDESKNLYFSIEKARTRPIHVAESSYEQQHYATNPNNNNNDNNSNNSSSRNTQITNSDDNNHNTNTTTFTNSSNNADMNSETNSNNATMYTAYTYDEARTEEDEWSLAALLEDESKEMVRLSADHALSFGRLEEANNSIDNVINSQLECSSQPTMAGIWASSSSSQSIVKMVEDHFDDCYKGLGTLPEVDRFEQGVFDSIDMINDDKT